MPTATQIVRTRPAAHGPSPLARKLEKENESLRSRLTRLRQGADIQSGRIIDVGITLGGAFLAGAYEHRAAVRGDAAPASVFGLPWKLTWGAAAVFGGPMIGGETGRLIARAGLGVACAGAAQAGVASNVLLGSSDMSAAAANTAGRMGNSQTR